MYCVLQVNVPPAVCNEVIHYAVLNSCRQQSVVQSTLLGIACLLFQRDRYRSEERFV